MRTRGWSTNRRIAFLFIVLAAACGGGGDGGPTDPAASIAISTSSANLSLPPGQSGSVTVTVTRNGGYTGAVSLALENAPVGVTGTFSPVSLSGTTASSTLTINATSAAAAGSTNLTIRASGSGVDSKALQLVLTVTAPATGGFTLSLSSPNLNLVQGTNGSVTVRVNRTGPFTGAVSVVPSNVPANVTVTPNPAPVSAASAQLSVAVAAGAAPGTYPITLRGTGTGATDQQLTLTLQVVTPPTGSAVTLGFCQADPPILVASQSDNGVWLRAAAGATPNSYTFNIANRGGYAVVYNASGGGFRLEITYGTAAEIASSGTQCTDATGSKALTGTFATLTAADEGYVSLGGAEAARMGPGSYQLFDVGDGPLDLFGMRSATTTTSFTPNKMVLRRGVNLANNSTIPVIDFGAAEAFDPASATLTMNNLGTDGPFLLVSLATANGGTGQYFIGGLFGGGAAQPWYGVPDARLTTGDLHNIIAFGVNTTGDQFRAVYLWSRLVAARTVTLGPGVSAPTITVAGTTPYVRHRAQLARQPEYPQGILIQLEQNSQTGGPNYRLVSVQATTGYVGAGTTWDVTVPDVSGASGFETTWGPQTGSTTGYTIGAIGGPGDINAPPADGTSFSIGFRSGNAASSSAGPVSGEVQTALQRARAGWSWLRRTP